MNGETHFGKISIRPLLTEMFLAKYKGTTGDVQWVQHAGSNNAVGSAVTVDANDAFYVSVFFMKEAFFGTYKLVAYGYIDMFVANYDASSGKFLWARHAG
jgi:hypothetical protein